jgi:hypothetical protein
MNPTGHITGGWGFVYAAYSWTAIVLTVYAVTLISRLRAARNRPSDENNPG